MAKRRQRPTPEEFKQTDKEAENLHPRSAVILLTSQLELFLDDAIFESLARNEDDLIARLIDSNGPLSSFSSKILIAYALGVISKDTRGDLDILRNVRNEFAHSPRPIDFYTPEISDRIENLKCIKRKKYIKLKRPAQMLGVKFDPVREKFTDACELLSLQLNGKRPAKSKAVFRILE
jgi:DNA-binding MltR family transcriptional regulator